eukprot:5455827-Prymnesium_polylepis.1
MRRSLCLCLLASAQCGALHHPVLRRPLPPRSARMHAPRMLAALPAAAIGGTFAGGLHAVSGPDHLAALLPMCMGRRWYRAVSAGALWGIGHGVGSALVGVLGFALRGAFNIDAVASYMEVAVGISI